MRYSNAFGIESSKILLGTTYFGSLISIDDAFDILDKYYELGGNHIDCARMYSDGEAEKIIGKWIKSRKVNKVLVSSKGGFPDMNNGGKSRLSEKDIRFDMDLSLSSLCTDCIDFYWLHRDDENIPAGEIIEMMNRFVAEGRIRKFGASNWKSQRIDEANKYSEAHGLAGFEASQIRFSPAVIAPGGNDDPTLVDMSKEECSFYDKKKMPVAAFASQAKGFFSKLANGGEASLSIKSHNRYFCDENLKRYGIIKELSEKYDCSIAAIVCASMCSIDSPDIFPIIGGSNPDQISDSMSGGDLVLERREIELIFN